MPLPRPQGSDKRVHQPCAALPMRRVHRLESPAAGRAPAAKCLAGNSRDTPMPVRSRRFRPVHRTGLDAGKPFHAEPVELEQNSSAPRRRRVISGTSVLSRRLFPRSDPAGAFHQQDHRQLPTTPACGYPAWIFSISVWPDQFRPSPPNPQVRRVTVTQLQPRKLFILAAMPANNRATPASKRRCVFDRLAPCNSLATISSSKNGSINL